MFCLDRLCYAALASPVVLSVIVTVSALVGAGCYALLCWWRGR